MRWDYAVIIGAMRTGSNFLEEALATLPGVTAYGEIFNPHFIGRPDRDTVMGVTLAEREADPLRLIRLIAERSTGLPLFRLFHDHDPRAMDHVLSDPRAAKIVLRRAPLDSWISLCIAKATGQWWLGDDTSARSAKVAFDAAAFDAYRAELDAFHLKTARALQVTGQTAFRVAFEELTDADVLAGLARFLGQEATPDLSGVQARRQNPAAAEDKLSNPESARQYFADVPDLSVSAGEARMWPYPSVRQAVVLDDPPLLYLPMPGAGPDPVAVALDGQSGLGGRGLRLWMKAHPGHRAVTVLRHPLRRAWDSFVRSVLPTEPPRPDIRAALVSRYGLPLPAAWPDADYDLATCREAFRGYLDVLARSLVGQSSLGAEAHWVGQAAMLAGLSAVRSPDRILREEEASRVLTEITGRTVDLDWAAPAPFALDDIADRRIRTAAFRAYRRDYVTLGFER